MNRALVIVEHDNRELKSASLNTITAAVAIGAEIDLLVAGMGCREVVSAAARIEDVGRVLAVDDALYEHGLAENVALLVAKVAPRYSHLLAPATTFGKNIMPRIAALLDVAQISDIVAVLGDETFVRPIYAGNAMATVRSADPIKAITVRTSVFEAAKVGSNSARVEMLPSAQGVAGATFIERKLSVSKRPELADARIVVAGGRGLGSAENFRRLEELADRLGAAIGASRAAVDAGYAGNDLQVGQTGKIVAPELYFAVGISGAIQHLAGMRESRVIVAINNDPEAPIFKLADYALLADWAEALPGLMAALEVSE